MDKIPNEFTVNYEATSYHVYATSDKMVCFQCKKEGHTSKFCPLNKPHSSPQGQGQQQNISQAKITPTADNVNPLLNVKSQTAHIPTPDDKEDYFDSSELPLGAASDTHNNSKTAGLTLSDSTSAMPESEVLTFDGKALFAKPTPQKRSHAPSSCTSSTTSADEIIDTQKTNQGEKTQPKKMKKLKSNPEVIEEQVKLAEKLIPTETAATFPVTYDQLIEIIASTIDIGYIGLADKIKETINIESLVVMLQEVYTRVTEQAVKARITRTTKALRGVIVNDSPEGSDVGS